MEIDDIGIRLDQISSQLRVLEVRTEGVSRMSGEAQDKLKSLESQVQNPASKEGWRSTVVQLIAIPAALIAIYLQINQAQDAPINREKTLVEISKTQTEELKTRAELQGLLAELTQKREKGAVEYQRELNQALPKLESLLSQIATVGEKARADGTYILLMKYVILYIFGSALSLLFNAIHAVWYPTVSTISMALQRYIGYKNPRRNMWQSVINFATIVISPLPSIVSTVIQVALFAAVLWPLFDILAGILGSGIRFQQIAQALTHFRFAEAIEMLKKVILA